MGVPLESTIRECSGGLKSARAKERKKCADTLKDFLSQNNAPAMLSENTLKGNGFNWTDIFNDISEFIFKESESSKTYDSVIASLSSSLLNLCVAGSIKGKAYVRCEELMDTSLTILKDSRLARVIGDAYLSLLYKHVLQNEHYQNMITPSNWEDLIEICIQTCLTNNSKLDDFTKLSLVYLAMRNCTKCCQLIIPLRDSLSQLKTCFARVMNDIKVQEVIINIVTLLLEILSSECRLCMCEFTESMMTSFLKFYDQNFDEKKKSSLFKLLSLTVALHHPQGKLQHQECSLAHDWTIWNKSLSSILEIISMEASFLQKVSKPNDDLLKECVNFYTVSASTYFLVFNMSKQTENSDSSHKSASKRKMTQPTKNKCFSDIVDELRQNHIPWLGIIEMYLQKYAYFVLITDAVALLNVIEQILANNNNIVDWDTLQSLACTTLKRLERRKCDAINYDEILLSLWNLCVRNSTSSTGIFKVTHSIMQLILRLDTLQYAQVQPLINQYFENGMLVTDSSVVTLKTLFHKFFNKFSLEDKRLECLAWLIQGNITSVGISYLRDFLLQVLSNDNVKIDSDIDLQHDFELNDIFESVEKCILFSEFDIKYSEPKPKQNQSKEALEINSNINKRVCDNMIEKVLYYSKKLNQSEVNITEYLKIVNIALSYIDINLKHEGLQHEYLKNTEIYRTLNIASKQVFDTLVSQLQSNKQITEKNAILKSAQAILISDYDPLINTMIRDNIGSAFISCLNSIMCSDNEETEDVVEVDLEYYSDSYSLKYSCTSVLSSYCRTPGSYRGEVLDHILDATSYDFNVQLDIECAFNCIDLLSDSNLENRPIGNVYSS